MKLNTTEGITHLLRAFNGLVQIGVLLFTGIFLYAIVFEQPYLSYPNLPMQTVGRTFQAGDVVPIVMQRCNNSSEAKTFVSSHALMNILTHRPTLPTLNLIEAKPGCTSVFINTGNRLPIDTPPGVYHYAGRSEVNGILRTFDVIWSTQDFEVVAK